MANNYISYKLSYDTAYRFVEDFSSSDHNSLKFVFIGNSNQYPNSDSDIANTSDTVVDERLVWQNMFAAKRVTGNDVELVIPRKMWANNTVYAQYDDTVLLANMVSEIDNTMPFYVMTDEGNVYKCVSNNNGAPSLQKPTGDYSTSNGFIITTDIGGQQSYIWKYMYNVKQDNRFLTNDWIPAPTTVYAQEYGTSEINLVDGALASIQMINVGSGYIDSNVTVLPYYSGNSVISVYDTANISEQMYVSGAGIEFGVYITHVDYINRKITLSLPVTGNSSLVDPEIRTSTRAYVEGDGNKDVQTQVYLSNSTVSKILITSVGTGYSQANVYIYGTGTGANARAVIGPKLGHGFNPARELGARSVMVLKTFGEIDSSENGIISTNTSFRQYGIVSKPHKYGEITPVSRANANTIVSQTLDLTLLPGSDYVLGESVYQGLELGEITFSGIVHAQNPDTNVVRLTNVKGSVTIGGLLKGSTVQRPISSVDYPFFEPYTGDVLTVQNIPKVERTEGQAENIKLVINF